MTNNRHTDRIIVPVFIILMTLIIGCTGPGSPGGGGITVGSTDAPVVSPAAGIISNQTGITITSGTSGATIFYTTDGTDPASGNEYTGPFTLAAGSTYTVKTFARLDGLTDSATISSDFTVVDQVAPVTFTTPGGAVPDNQDLVLSTSTLSAAIYYTFTTDGSVPADPTSADTEYTVPLTLADFAAETLNLKAVAVMAGSSDSDITGADYVKATAAAPVSDQADGTTISDSMAITLTGDTPSSSIYYTFTTDGSVPADPTAASTLYTLPLTPALGSYNLKAIAAAPGYKDSPVISVSLTVIAQADVPTIDTASGFVLSGTDISLSVPGGETIYYTTDGSDPAVSGIEYTAPVNLTESLSLRAYAAGDGFYPSAETSADYLVYESIDTLAPDTGALMAVSSDGSVVVRAGGTYYDLNLGSFISRTVTEPAGSVADFTIDDAGHLHALYLDGSTLYYWTSDGGTIATLSTIVSIADARIVLDSSGSSRIVFAETNKIVEAVYTASGAQSGAFSAFTLPDAVRSLDAAADSADRLYIAVARTKNATQTTRVGYFDAGVWNEYLTEIQNRSNPALTVESDDSLLLAYVRTDKSWFFLNDFTADTKLNAVVNQGIPGDTAMAYDASGNLYISSHNSAWIMNADQTALNMSTGPYRVVSDPSVSENLYILGTSGLALYAMK